MRLRLRDMLWTSALLAGVVFLYALQQSDRPAPTAAPVLVAPGPKPVLVAPAPASVVRDVPLPGNAPSRTLDRYRQFGLPSATDMLLYFPMQPAPGPRLLIPLPLKKL